MLSWAASNLALNIFSNGATPTSLGSWFQHLSTFSVKNLLSFSLKKLKMLKSTGPSTEPWGHHLSAAILFWCSQVKSLSKMLQENSNVQISLLLVTDAIIMTITYLLYQYFVRMIGDSRKSDRTTIHIKAKPHLVCKWEGYIHC